jgi:small GTP-binding protein
MQEVKTVLIGSHGVGKTTMLRFWVRHAFDELVRPTVGAGLETVNVEYEGQEYRMQIWDTAGQEQYQSLTGSFARGVSGAMIVFDLSDHESFEDLSEWIKFVDTKDYVIVGNKSDIKPRKVTAAEMRKFAQGHMCFETSALTGSGIEDAFAGLVHVTCGKGTASASKAAGSGKSAAKKPPAKKQNSSASKPAPKKPAPSPRTVDLSEKEEDNEKGCCG